MTWRSMSSLRLFTEGLAFCDILNEGVVMDGWQMKQWLFLVLEHLYVLELQFLFFSFFSFVRVICESELVMR